MIINFTDDFDPVLRISEVCQIIRISRPTLYRCVERGILPKPIVISPGLRGYRKSTIEKYLEGSLRT